MTDEIIRRCKQYIDEKNTSALQVFYDEIPDLYDIEKLDWPMIFHRVYLHACLRGNELLATWMKAELYPKMDPIQQIALRQIFPYGNHLLHRASKTH
jgi:hypothetical protein